MARNDTLRLADGTSVSIYINREMSWLAFNERVLAQADDDRVPLLERLRHLTIVSSNLDEFFEIRVSGLHELARVDDASATEARASLAAISARVNRLVARFAGDPYSSP